MRGGIKQPIKNIGIVVKNAIKIAIDPTPFAKGFNFNEVASEWRIKQPLHGQRFAKRVVSRLYVELEDKLKNKQFSNLELWSSLLDCGVNPVDFILPEIDAKNIWWLGNHQHLAPALLCQTTTHPTMPQFDVHAVMASVVEMNAVFERVLELTPIIYEKDESPEFFGAKARLFAVLAATDHVLVLAAYSPLIRSCFEAWVDELKDMSDIRKMACIGYVFNRFERLSGYAFQHRCPVDFFEPCHDFFQFAVSRLSQVSLGADVKNSFGIDGVEHYKYIFEYLNMNSGERTEIAQRIAQTGNANLLCGTMLSLIKDPESYAKALRACDASDDLAHEILRQNLNTEIYSNAALYSDISKVDAIVERFRAAFIEQGYSDLIGSKGLDGLAVSLELGEHFEKKGYLRRAGDFEMPTCFASQLNWGKMPKDQTPESLAFQRSIIRRKVDLAVSLGQTQFLKDQFDAFFKGNTVANKDLGNAVALKHVLETGGLLAADVITTKVRLEKAVAAGVDVPLLVSQLKLTRQQRGELLENAIGL
jgi:hypothetical protein